MEWFFELSKIQQGLVIAVSVLLLCYAVFCLVKAMAQFSVNKELDKFGLLIVEGDSQLYASRQVYKIHVDNCMTDHPLGDSLFPYKFCAEFDGYILLRVVGGKNPSDYPPSWPDHVLRVVIDRFGSTGIFVPGGKSDNIASVYERELVLVSDAEYDGYLKARERKN